MRSAGCSSCRARGCAGASMRTVTASPIPWNPTDAVFAAARYLAAAGGTSDLYRGVYAYNHADWYVNEVLSLADVYGADQTVAFSLDRLQVNLDAARQVAAEAGDRVVALQTTIRRETRIAARWQARADKAALLSDRLALEQRAGQALDRRNAATARARGAAAEARGRTADARPRAAGVRLLVVRPRGVAALRRAVVLGRLRLPGRRRPRRDLRLAHPPRLSGRRHRRARRAPRSTPSRTRPSCAPGRRPTRAAASASRSAPSTARSGPTAISRCSTRTSSRAPHSSPASRWASSARPVTRAGRTSISSSSRPPRGRSRRPGSSPSPAGPSPGRMAEHSP